MSVQMPSPTSQSNCLSAIRFHLVAACTTWRVDALVEPEAARELDRRARAVAVEVVVDAAFPGHDERHLDAEQVQLAAEAVLDVALHRGDSALRLLAIEERAVVVGQDLLDLLVGADAGSRQVRLLVRNEGHGFLLSGLGILGRGGPQAPARFGQGWCTRRGPCRNRPLRGPCRPVTEPNPSPCLLVTNDDGFDAAGLAAFGRGGSRPRPRRRRRPRPGAQRGRSRADAGPAVAGAQARRGPVRGRRDADGLRPPGRVQSDRRPASRSGCLGHQPRRQPRGRRDVFRDGRRRPRGDAAAHPVDRGFRRARRRRHGGLHGRRGASPGASPKRCSRTAYLPASCSTSTSPGDRRAASHHAAGDAHLSRGGRRAARPVRPAVLLDRRGGHDAGAENKTAITRRSPTGYVSVTPLHADMTHEPSRAVARGVGARASHERGGHPPRADGARARERGASRNRRVLDALRRGPPRAVRRGGAARPRRTTTPRSRSARSRRSRSLGSSRA